jgi:hypothetical protein
VDAAIAIAIGVVFVLGLVASLVYAWRNRPVRAADDGEQKYLTTFNIANVKDFGAYNRRRRGGE